MLVIFFLNIKHLYFLFLSRNNNNNNKTISKFKIFLKSKKITFLLYKRWKMQKFRFEERKQRNRRERLQNVKEMRFLFFR